jgi:hypothetical protein
MTVKIDTSPAGPRAAASGATEPSSGGDRGLVPARGSSPVVEVEVEGNRREHAVPPIVVDLGKKKRKQIKQLKKGTGPLWKEVESVIEQVRGELGGELADKTLVPLVLIYRKKSRRSRSVTSLFSRS